MTPITSIGTKMRRHSRSGHSRRQRSSRKFVLGNRLRNRSGDSSIRTSWTPPSLEPSTEVMKNGYRGRGVSLAVNRMHRAFIGHNGGEYVPVGTQDTADYEEQKTCAMNMLEKCCKRGTARTIVTAHNSELNSYDCF